MRLHALVKIFLVCACTLFASIAAAVDLSSYNGEQLFRRFCASCHGTDAQGNGSVSSSLAVVVPDLSRIAKRHGGKFPNERIHQIIDGRLTRPPHGTRDMPVWGWELSRVDGDDDAARERTEAVIAKMVEYLRSIQK
ncbi:MAG TPA: cytochrome c [Steroidobacteraceae bacterium]|nr:cytochrome c [Steroidobacteraceae bacterium]